MPTTNRRAPISILYLIYGFRIGGAERHLLDLCKGLDPQRFRCEIIYFHREEQLLEEFLKAGIRCTRFPVKGHELTIAEVWGLSRIIRSRAPQLVHVHLYHAGRYGALAAFLGGVRLIVRTKHNVGEPGRRPGKRDRLWETFLPLITTRTVGVSKAISAQIGTPYVIYNGVDTDFFQPEKIDRKERDDALAEFKVHGSPVVGIVGRLTKQKGHEVLLRAVADVAMEWPELALLIAGDGEERKRLEQLTEDLGVRKWVTFLGAVNNVREFLSILDLFVHPSLWEGLGISVLEAMAMACPVVATNVDGLAEIINNEVDGLLVYPNDPGALAKAINRVLRDRDLGLRLGIKARERITRTFSLRAMIWGYEQMYLELTR